jgi:hypothetical protein
MFFESCCITNPRFRVIDKEMHPIEEVDFADSRIRVEEEQVQLRIYFLHLLFRALGDDVIGNAAERLQAQHIVDAVLGKGSHLACNEPAFAVLVVQTKNLLCVLCDSLNVRVTMETSIFLHNAVGFI